MRSKWHEESPSHSCYSEKPLEQRKTYPGVSSNVTRVTSLGGGGGVEERMMQEVQE